MAKSRAGGCLMQKESHTVAKITSDGFQFLLRPPRWQVAPTLLRPHTVRLLESLLETCVPKTERLMA
jgi:hypothetical protein